MNEQTIKQLEHEECLSLLPAYINGQLSSQKLRAVQQHIARCPQCFDAQQQAHTLRDALDTPPHEIEDLLSSSAMERNLNKTLGKINQQTQLDQRIESTPSLAAQMRQLWMNLSWSIKSILVGQTASLIAAIAVIAFLINQPVSMNNMDATAIKSYQTLSDAPTSATTTHLKDMQVFRIVFHQAATEQDIRSLLVSVEGQIISGPSVAGVYTLATLKKEQQISAILNTLRQSPWITLAEPAVNYSNPSQTTN